MGFLNKNNKDKAKRDVETFSSPFSFATLEQDAEILRLLKDFTPKPATNRRARTNKYCICGHENGMNYLTLSTFMPSSDESVMFLNELLDCVSDFDDNTDPISVILPMNGGGSVVLEQISEFLLAPDSDYRQLTAARKTDAVKKVLVEDQYGSVLARGRMQQLQYRRKTAEDVGAYCC